ncbi:META domain-containing protein [Sphingobacterium wenxiniae]|uniref:Heat shock protein HslJ n=1 Tax=Sphingobacterium wenxiniae TaxID=683125 RepID=A0A1I6VA37_9SPHI|nr:META domain-containing protein [Sphingobacterium wenxiniae]SFT10613.1 Heat shock protein HslJ [Sphingobacterium wenxiniae]
MKKMNVSYMMIALVAMLSSCSVKKATEVATSDIVGKKWQLIELEGNPVADKVNGKVPFLELRTEDSTYAASGGCNGIGGKYEWAKNNGIKFSMGVSTMMACQDMSAENGLRNLFGKAENYRLENDTLVFSSENGSVLAKFKLANETKENDIALLDGTWELDYVMDPDGKDFTALYPEKKPILTFEAGSSKVTGNSSCNNFTGNVTVEGHNIGFSPLGMTKMACPGEGEGVFVDALEKVNRFDIQDNALHFIMGDIAIMRFQKK